MLSTRTMTIAAAVYVGPLLFIGLFMAPLASHHGGLAFMLSGILASQAATYAHWREGGEAPLLRWKIRLGILFALEAVLAGAAWQAIAKPFAFPEIVIGIAAAAAPIFALLFTTQMWSTLAKRPRNPPKR